MCPVTFFILPLQVTEKIHLWQGSLWRIQRDVPLSSSYETTPSKTTKSPRNPWRKHLWSAFLTQAKPKWPNPASAHVCFQCCMPCLQGCFFYSCAQHTLCLLQFSVVANLPQEWEMKGEGLKSQDSCTSGRNGSYAIPSQWHKPSHGHTCIIMHICPQTKKSWDHFVTFAGSISVSSTPNQFLRSCPLHFVKSGQCAALQTGFLVCEKPPGKDGCNFPWES